MNVGSCRQQWLLDRDALSSDHCDANALIIIFDLLVSIIEF